MSQPKKPKKVDPLKGIKYIGYRMGNLPQRYDIPALVRYAKFHLCHATGRLMKDPIWDLYTVEELLAEFFARQFVDNKEAREIFEKSLTDINGEVDDFASWADKQIAEEDKIRKRLIDNAEQSVRFDPGMVLGEDE